MIKGKESGKNVVGFNLTDLLHKKENDNKKVCQQMKITYNVIMNYDRYVKNGNEKCESSPGSLGVASKPSVLSSRAIG